MAQETIVVKSTPEGPIQKEWIMDAVVRPGQLVEYANSTRIQVLGESGTPAQMEIARVVVENSTIPVDGTHPSGDQIPFVVGRPGDELYCYATRTTAGTIPFGATLVSDAAGFLMDTGGTAISDQAVLAVGLESKAISANSIEQLKVEIL